MLGVTISKYPIAPRRMGIQLSQGFRKMREPALAPRATEYVKIRDGCH